MADAKRKIREGYDQIAPAYLEWATTRASPRNAYTNKVLQHLPASGSVLELGCGAGVPVTKMLVDHLSGPGARVVANDFSEQQILLARKNVPQAECIQADMMTLTFDPRTFDAVLSFYAIFHLPQDEQKIMLKRVFGWLRPDGRFAGSFATKNEANVNGALLGAEMSWSGLGVEEHKEVMKEIGFVLDEVEVVVSEDREDPDYQIPFLWILAHKPPE